MPLLGEKPTLSDFQKYVVELELERGFSDQDIFKKCLLMGEEMGELFQAIRHHTKMSVDANAESSDVGEEVADLFIMLCSVANKLHINMEEAFRKKEEINKQREWSKRS